MAFKTKSLSSDELRERLEQVKEQIQEALSECDTDALIELKAQKDVLPIQILKAEIEEAEETVVKTEAEIESLSKASDKAHAAYHSAIEKRKKAEAALKTAQKVEQDADAKRNRASWLVNCANTKKLETRTMIETLKSELSQLITGEPPTEPPPALQNPTHRTARVLRQVNPGNNPIVNPQPTMDTFDEQLFNLAQQAGFPSVEVAAGSRVMPRQDSWKSFAANGSAEHRDAARQSLESILR